MAPYSSAAPRQVLAAMSTNGSGFAAVEGGNVDGGRGQGQRDFAGGEWPVDVRSFATRWATLDR